MKKIQLRDTPNDVVYTPLPVAELMIKICDIKDGDTVLDPSRGKGVFYDNLPSGCIKSYCEITDGKDFFNCNERYDLIIGNPPFSMWNKWLEHTMKLTDKFCYIMGIINMNEKRLDYIFKNGFGLTHMHLLTVKSWFACSIICVFEKNKPSIMNVSPTAFKDPIKKAEL